MRECLKKAANALSEGLQRLERAGKEVDAIKTHIGDFGKALSGRSENTPSPTENEKIVTKRKKERGLIQDLHGALLFCKGQVEGMEKKTLGAMDTLEHLHRMSGSKGEITAPVGERKVSELQMPKQR